MHYPRFLKFFQDCQLLHGHVTERFLSHVFDETMKSNNDDGKWVGSPRNRSSPARNLRRASFSTASGIPTPTQAPNGSQPGTGSDRDADASSQHDASSPLSPTNHHGESRIVPFMCWESFVWAFFKVARARRLPQDKMVRNALTNHPYSFGPPRMLLSEAVSPVVEVSSLLPN